MAMHAHRSTWHVENTRPLHMYASSCSYRAPYRREHVGLRARVLDRTRLQLDLGHEKQEKKRDRERTRRKKKEVEMWC